MEKEVFITWKEEYSVGISVVDEQHQELIKMTNELQAICLAGQSMVQQRFMDIIHKTVDYIAFHFSTEEKLMKAASYPDFASHKKEHDIFVQKVIETLADSQKLFRKKSAPYKFAAFLRAWISDHIAKIDKAFGNYMLELK